MRPSRLGLFDQFVGRADLLGEGHQLVLFHGGQAADLTQHGAGVADGLDHVTGAGFALGADHGRAFADAAEGLAQVAAAAHEGDLEVVLVDMVLLVGGGEHLGLVDVVDADGFQDLRFDEMTDAAFGHDRDGDGIHDLEDQVGVGHAGHAALGADVGGDAFERHDGAGAGVFGDAGVFGGDHVHDDAALEHLGQAFFDSKSSSFLFHDVLLIFSSREGGFWLMNNETLLLFKF